MKCCGGLRRRRRRGGRTIHTCRLLVSTTASFTAFLLFRTLPQAQAVPARSGASLHNAVFNLAAAAPQILAPPAAVAECPGCIGLVFDNTRGNAPPSSSAQPGARSPASAPAPPPLPTYGAMMPAGSASSADNATSRLLLRRGVRPTLGL